MYIRSLQGGGNWRMTGVYIKGGFLSILLLTDPLLLVATFRPKLVLSNVENLYDLCNSDMLRGVGWGWGRYE